MTNFMPPSAQQRPIAPSAGAGKKSFDIVLIKQYFHIIVKRIWLVALCFVISLAVMVVMVVQQEPTYRCSASLLLSRGLPVPARLMPTETELQGEYVTTQQLIIQSSLMFARARERLNRPAEEIEKNITSISVYPVGKTAFMIIQVESRDPVIGAEMANALAEEYLDFKAEERMDTSQATVVSLTQQANRLHDELQKAEDRTLAFARENSVIAIQDRGNIAANHLASLAEQAAQYRTERMFLEAQQPLLAQASDEAVLATLMGPSTPMLGGMNSSIAGLPQGSNVTRTAMAPQGSAGLIEYGLVQRAGWEELRRQKSELESQLVEYRKRYRDAHPSIQKTLVDIQDNERAIAVEMQFALRQFYSQLESLSIREQAAKRVEQEWEEEALEVSRKAQEYRNIQRNIERLQGLYDLVFNRLKEIDISVGIEPESVRIMERAQPSYTPITPRKLQSIFMAALIGLGIGLGLVFGLEYIDDSIRYPEEVTQGLGLPFFGLVPSANWDPEDLRTHLLANIDQKSGLAEAYRNIRSSLLFSGAEDSVRTLAMTSAVPKEGKTTTSINLSVCLAQAGSRVLIVDADLRRGEVHKFFGLEGGRGLSDILTGQAKPEAVIQRTGLPNLDLVATGPFPPNPAEIVLRHEFVSFVEYAKRTYDRIVFDCPPVLAVSEAGILASLVDGCLLVVWAGQTSRKLSQLAAQTLRERGANILGVVLNNLDFGRVGYYYYSTYYGYYDYDNLYDKKPAAGP
ncbi:MAG TPA: polysaccharide biosynthesis tyrosine autokinase [Kiritimatiellia bacterium]|nr:polysaccharide biosynthesis tyrosine autokinase [Kiritimatiellia bacterium]